MQSGAGVILKVDRRQRVRRTAAQQAELLAEYQRSGISAAEFARLSGLKYQTLCGWLRRSRPRTAAAAPPAVKWVEAVRAEARVGLKLEFPGGAWTEVSDERQVGLAVKLILALARPC
jgi:lambda repressor-like predicted transcriptional regulator